MATAEAVELCPACGRRDVSTPAGLCETCVVERAVESFREQDRRRVRRSVLQWSERTAGPKAQHSRLKQQRSRLMRMVKPREPMSEPADPLMLAHDALTQLGVVRLSVRDRPRALERIDAVEEAIRRLAWARTMSTNEAAT